MKKCLLSFAILFIASAMVRAQKIDTAQLLVHYKFFHTRDTANRTNPYTENMVLIVGKRVAAYKSYDRLLEIEQLRKQVLDQLKNSPDGSLHINRRSMASETAWYQFPETRKMTLTTPLFINRYLVTGDLPVIDWKITNDTTNLGGLHCQKATGHFKGRDYIAWFCPDLPLRVGPWKLNSLPGVILEAYDNKNEVVFKFDGIEKTVAKASQENLTTAQKSVIQGLLGTDEEDTDPDIIQLPENVLRISEKDFVNLETAMRKNPGAFIEMAAKAGNSPGYNGPQPRMSINPEPLFNNPIELPESK